MSYFKNIAKWAGKEISILALGHHALPFAAILLPSLVAIVVDVSAGFPQKLTVYERNYSRGVGLNSAETWVLSAQFAWLLYLGWATPENKQFWHHAFRPLHFMLKVKNPVWRVGLIVLWCLGPSAAVLAASQLLHHQSGTAHALFYIAPILLSVSTPKTRQFFGIWREDDQNQGPN
ncbi:MAG: hypothetical protein JNK21_12600 [Rhodospirillaceae bacterium]|nr:hypothetical protein [Rhodospirillaceae bacterium]